MSATTLPPTVIGCCILAQLLLLICLPASGLNCLRTDATSQAHTRDCGPKARGCRILVFPYRTYNESAVGICRKDLKGGDFIYDCAVDCPDKSKLDWNEMLCCKGENCNGNLDDVIKQNYCYTSKTDSLERDNLLVCADNQRCALNVLTQDTQCVDESVCSDKKTWLCCTSKENCGNTWGMPKVESVTEAESTEANNLTASVLMSVASIIAFYVTVL